MAEQRQLPHPAIVKHDLDYTLTWMVFSKKLENRAKARNHLACGRNNSVANMRRRMTEIETEQAQLVFAGGLHYSRVWIYESARLPNWVAKVGSCIQRQPPPENNAITLGNRVLFPLILRTESADLENGIFGDMGWLIHEFTHVWQYQHTGLRYLFDALVVQLKYGDKAYDYGGQAGLLQAIAEGKTLADFNPEQQGDIARDYYLLLKRGEDPAPWAPIIDPFQSEPS